MTIRGTGLYLLCALLIGCGGGETTDENAPPREAVSESEITLPEYHGLYAVGKGKLIDLAQQKNLLDVSGDVEFIFFDKSVVSAGGKWGVHPGRYSRMSGGWAPARNNIRCRTKSVTDHPEMVRIIPIESLKAGPYSIIGTGPWNLRKANLIVEGDDFRKGLMEQARTLENQKNWGATAKAAEKAASLLEKGPDKNAMNSLVQRAMKAAFETELESFRKRARQAFQEKRWDDAKGFARKALIRRRKDPEMNQLLKDIPKARLDAEVAKALAQ